MTSLDSTLHQGLLALTSFAAAPALAHEITPPDSPVVERASLLDSLEVQRRSAGEGLGGRVRISGPGITVAFLPGPDTWLPYDVESSGGHRLAAHLEHEGGVVARFPLTVNRIEGVFSRAKVRGVTRELEAEGFVSEYALRASGDYALAVVMDDEVIARLDFRVDLRPSEDPFQPAPTTLVDGPWESAAYLAARPDQEDPRVEFHTWLRAPEGAARAEFEVDVYRGDERVAAGGRRIVGEPAYERHEFRLTWAERQPGAFGMRALCVEDGDLRVVVKRDGEPWAEYSAQVSGGALELAPTSRPDALGGDGYVLPRQWEQSASKRRATWWLEPSDR